MKRALQQRPDAQHERIGAGTTDGLAPAMRTLMQRSPPQSPIAVPTTPGIFMSESVCAAST